MSVLSKIFPVPQNLIPNTAALLLLLLLVMGCDNSVKHAKANAIRQQTRRTNDIHAAKLADNKALEPTRLNVKAGLWVSMGIAGAILLFGVASAGSIYVMGTALNRVRFHRIALDNTTKQYPLIVYGNGKRLFNPNTGERLLLAENSSADIRRIEATTRVQLAGLLPSVIDGEVSQWQD